MVHSGYEASAVNHTFGSLTGLLSTAKAVLFGGKYANTKAAADLESDSTGGHLPVVPLTVNGSKSGHQETVGV